MILLFNATVLNCFVVYTEISIVHLPTLKLIFKRQPRLLLYYTLITLGFFNVTTHYIHIHSLKRT